VHRSLQTVTSPRCAARCTAAARRATARHAVARRAGGPGGMAGVHQGQVAHALLDKARSTIDVAAARDLYVEAQQIIFNDGGVVIPFLKNGRRVLSGNVTGLPNNREEFIRWHMVDLTE